MAHDFSLGTVQVALAPRERFEEFLQSRGKRVTEQRRIIVEEVFRRHDHFDAEDLIRIGAYVKGTSPAVDKAVELRPQILSFLKQEMDERTDFDQTRAIMERIAAAWPF